MDLGHTVAPRRAPGSARSPRLESRRRRLAAALAALIAAASLAVARGTMTTVDRDALAAIITKMGPLPSVSDLSAQQVIEAVARDKKVIAGRLHFVLPVGIGTTTTVSDVTGEELNAAARGIGLGA